MASLVIDTGVESHPQISIDTIDLAREQIGFKFLGGPYGGDCMEPFTITLEDHGDMTMNELAAAIAADMVAKLPDSD